MSAADWIVLGLVLAAAGAAVFFTIRRKRRGKGCSCGDCGSCSACCAKKGADKNR